MIVILTLKLHRKYQKYKQRFWVVGCVISVISFFVYYILFGKSIPKTKLIDSHITSVSNPQSILSDKILCYIPISRDRLRVGKLILESWGSKCDELIFFGDFNKDFIPRKYQDLNLKVEQLNVTERYELLWGKTKATLVQLHHKFGNKFDWFFKADDDTFVILENLRRFIKELNTTITNAPLWFGYKMKHKKMKHGYMSGGSGYAMNVKALSKIASFIEKNKHQDIVEYDPSTMKRPEGCKTATDEGIEDLELGRCFHFLGIRDTPTHDHLGRHRFLPLPISTLMSGNVDLTHWIWTQSWHPLRLGHDCCSRDLISIHKVSPAELKLYYFLLYELQVQ